VFVTITKAYVAIDLYLVSATVSLQCDGADRYYL